MNIELSKSVAVNFAVFFTIIALACFAAAFCRWLRCKRVNHRRTEGPRFALGICLACFAGLLWLASGCTTTTTVTPGETTNTNSAGVVTTNAILTTNVTKILDIAATTNAIDAALPLLVGLAVQSDTNARPYIADAAAAITVFVNATNLTPAALDATLKQIPNSTVQSAQVITVANALYAFYAAAYGQVVEQKLNQVQYLVPILQAIASSLNAGLGVQ